MGALSFVESIAADPVVLIDLDDAPLRLESWQAPPPRVRRSVASSNMVDGGVDTAVSFELRELTATLTVDAADEDEAAAVLSAIGRALSAPRWLRYQAGTSEAVFFRTRVCAPDEIDEFGLTNPGVKRITLVIPADPFAYGLPESGTATVVNDPTEPNGMRFTVEDVKGDVPAPLVLELEGSVYRSRHEISYAVTTDLDGFHESTVAPADPPSYPDDDWTITTSTTYPSDLIEGSVQRITSPGLGDRLALTATFADVTPGDYRIYVRAGVYSALPPGGSMALRVTGAVETNIGVWPAVDRFTDGEDLGTVEINSIMGWIHIPWADCGVIRVPAASKRGAPSAEAKVLMLLEDRVNGSVTYIDHAVLVPVPGGDGNRGTFGKIADSHGSNKYWIDSEDDYASASSIASGAPTGEFVVAGMSGGLPRVEPGLDNLVVLVAESTWLNADWTVDWSYHPRYLYLRGD